uniref:Uncharacterized protein n=1 Tax=Anopheles epiroticus TaxID=199890 RepID=A0A182PQY1_9DIPT
MSMSRNLCDETFPANLLIEFDELDDEIPISPELTKRHHHHHRQPDSFLHHHQHHRRNLSSDGKGTISDKTNVDDRNGSRMVVSGSSNTSSGHSSLSTEGENRSASSDRDSSRDLSKRVQSKEGGSDGGSTDKLTLKPRKIRQPRSMESLLQHQEQRLKLAAPLGSGTGLSGAGSTGNVSVRSAGSATQPHYQRHRSKYGHVQSKVKQMIEEMKPPPANRERKTLVRHKSMPETSYDADSKDEDEEALAQESDVETLRAVVREMRRRIGSLEQQHTLSHANLFNEMATLKCKISTLRIENDQLLEQVRAREQRWQLLRDQQSGGSCYGSQSSLFKAQSGHTCTIATQTSPTLLDHDLHFEFLLTSPPNKHASSPTTDPETPVGEFSPDYEQLIPVLGQGSACESDLHRRTPSFVRSPAGRRSESVQTRDFATSPTCHDCRRRKKKRKSRKQKLASLFCIRQHDESL